MKPKKLNLQEITRIYLLLKPAIDELKEEDIVLDSIYKFIDITSSKALLECIHIMYDNTIVFEDLDEFIDLFVKSIFENDFFEFIGFIRGITDGSRQ